MIDVIVVGAGHAGCEAAHISSKMGKKTLLLTININNIADMPCNPSIGGTSKGVIVREVDALGGLMGKIADKSLLQLKMLNASKGPAVQCLRGQADKVIYQKEMVKYLDGLENLEIQESIVEDLIIENNVVKGVILEDGTEIKSKIVILTTGTYTKSNILIGNESIESGPHGEKRSNRLSDNLKENGLKIIRLKTGTPVRIKGSSVNFDKMSEEPGDKEKYSFSFDTESTYDVDNQRSCYLIYTNEKTHQVIVDNLDKSAMYGGNVTGTGPRYCPSIEDKLVRFQDKKRHQLFLEPESNFYDEWYLQGFSTSMPKDIQELMVKSLDGLENAEIMKYAYAIEYDAIDPLQINANLENKIIENLFTAGQINGTSGYEEAAGQGIIAGINAVMKLDDKDPIVLKRNEAYIGVLIDDLVTKGTIEPYRMLTSRAEFRLILRHDNADSRLTKIAYEKGAIEEEKYQRVIKKESDIENLIENLKIEKIKLENKTISKYDYLKRPEIKIEDLIDLKNKDIMKEVEVLVKYEGYIKKAIEQAEKLKKLEDKKIPVDIDYNLILNLASEAKQKLNNVKPKTIAQASRISGVNPSDISVLAVYLKKEYNKHE
ncbi:MAG: tRNA uridine-5-carboxymethylaminomethyl(34) synthesis enzyme MnmG [bacterium]